MGLFDGGGWRYGDGSPPPKWLLKEFKKALTLMGKNRESIHLFDTGPIDKSFTFIIAVVPTSNANELAKIIGDAVGGKLWFHQPSDLT